MSVIPDAVQSDTTRDVQHHSDPHTIRITNHGKIKAWVAYVLKFLEANEERPIVLHTLPASFAEPPQVPVNNDTAPLEQPQRPTGALSNATNNVPRLISVAEIIKREYLKTLELKRSIRLSGLHQYNEIGCLEDLGIAGISGTEGDERAKNIAAALASKNHVKQKQTPYMKITLSQCALPELAERGATYQPPIIRKLSKSAKKRTKRRERKSKVLDGAEHNPNAMARES